MTLEFQHRTLGQRVLFGSGTAATNLAAEIARLSARRVAIIATEGPNADRVTAGVTPALRWTEVTQHVPTELVERTRDAVVDLDVDLLVSVGGGSATGLAKAVALTTGLPVVAVPTTFAGSEATDVWGRTEGARKTTGTDDRVLPVTVVYDAELTRSMPPALAVASGLNAVAHCVDSLWAPRADPINAALAGEALRALGEGLRRIAGAPDSAAGHESVLYGAYLAAVAFASAGSGLHHKICHVLGGTFDLPHAATHAVMLPYVAAFNLDATPDAGDRIARALHGTTPMSALDDLWVDLAAPRRLADLGFRERDVAEAAAIVLPLVPPSNPRTVVAGTLDALLHEATTGTPAEAVRA